MTSLKSTLYLPVIKTLRSSDGTTIYAEAAGDPRNPSIVLAHGLGLSSAIFDNLFKDERLLAEVYLVRYDQRGQGRSGKPDTEEAYVSKLWADDYAAVIEAFGLKNPVHVGWSYGGTVAVDVVAHLPPGTLSGVVLLAAIPHCTTSSVLAISKIIVEFGPGLTTTSDVALSRSTGKELVDTCFNDAAAIPFDLITSWYGMATLTPPSVMSFLPGREHDTTKYFEEGKNGLPLLLLYGSKDKHVHGEVLAKEVGDHFKNLKVHVVEGGSHAAFYENQEEVVTELLSFMKRTEAYTKQRRS
ncbi:alpha/beta-hydrolase [Laetiporus sulphureus 93-53]|uniref:Alpha/beta-hydrolase n=1 Tax=Laetiporus sulphureus 93-53 TaxID=1314785 RepID=A0A165BEM6_9APHY|nr:alpha/beta-hydrolase [Laetiporus sulphureus 93-53]KZT00889.1 alpha/beta-hydrolase [Laetiporus sulphureus 93-53]